MTADTPRSMTADEAAAHIMRCAFEVPGVGLLVHTFRGGSGADWPAGAVIELVGGKVANTEVQWIGWANHPTGRCLRIDTLEEDSAGTSRRRSLWLDTVRPPDFAAVLVTARQYDEDRSTCYVVDLADGGQVHVRVWPDGNTHAAHRPDHHAVWGPPLPVRVES